MKEVTDIPARNATLVKKQLENTVVVTQIDSSCFLFTTYKSDILQSSCPGNQITTDHSVLIVGYGEYVSSVTETELNTPYFIVRNSYGDDWGIGGYMYIGMDETTPNDGVLGILQAPKSIKVAQALPN